MKSSTTVTPTKPCDQKDKENDDFSGEIWSKVYLPYFPSPQAESDAGDEEEFMDLGRAGLEV